MKRFLSLPLVVAIGCSTTLAQPTAGTAPTRVLATNRISAPMAARVSTNRAFLVRLPPSIDPKLRYTMYNMEANKRVTATNAINSSARVANVSLNPSAIQILKPDQPQPGTTGLLTRAKVILPAKIGVAKEISPGEVSLTTGDLFLQALESPLRWDSTRKCYATELAIGLDFEHDPGFSKLPVPLAFELIAEHASIDPREISITKIGPPYEHVLLRCEDGRREPVVIAHHPNIPAKPLKLQCIRELGDLVMLCESTRILGYGLGTAKATISRLAKDHFDFDDSTELALTVTTTGGKIVSGAAAIIPRNKSATEIDLRSAGIGSVELIARHGPFISSQRLEFVFPTGFIIAAIVGGCLGGYARSFRQRVGHSKRTSRMILEGCISGLIMVAAAVAGIVVFQVPTPVIGTELGAFLIAALSGYIGSAVIGRISGVTPSDGKSK